MEKNKLALIVIMLCVISLFAGAANTAEEDKAPAADTAAARRLIFFIFLHPIIMRGKSILGDLLRLTVIANLN